MQSTGLLRAGDSVASAEHKQAARLQVFRLPEQLSEGTILSIMADTHDAYLALARCICEQAERGREAGVKLHSLPASHRPWRLWPQGEKLLLSQ